MYWACLLGLKDAHETESKKLILGWTGAHMNSVKAGRARLHGGTEGESAEPPADLAGSVNRASRQWPVWTSANLLSFCQKH